MKKCNKCLIDKKEEDYPPRKGTIHFICRPCKQEYDREYYHKRKQELRPKKIEAIKKFRNNRNDLINSLKQKPCVDCNIQYNPWQMQFDHLKDKEFNISDRRMSKLVEVLKEIAKCELVCSNCHADRTHKRLQSGIGKVW